MTTENDGVSWTVYRTELLNLPRYTSPHIDCSSVRVCGARMRLPHITNMQSEILS